MKKIFFGLALMATAMIPVTGHAADGKVTFKGNVQGLQDSLIIFAPGANDTATRDTVLVKEGKFEFTLNVPEPTLIFGCTPGTMRQEEDIKFQFIAVPGETGIITGDVNKAFYFDGSTFYKQYNEGDRIIEAAGKPYQDFVTDLSARMAAGGSQEELSKEYREKAPALLQKISDATLNFIKEHPNYEASAAFVPNLRDPEEMKKAVALLSPEVREGRMKAYYQNVIDQMEERNKRAQKTTQGLTPGTQAPDFTLNDIHGAPLSLSSLRGKYVVLDFWGSWCVWCIKGFPDMKAYYEKYKGRFEILGIDCNDPEDKWKEAVKKHNLPWLHVYNPRGGKVLADYAIQGFPTKIIVDPDGKIVKTIVGEDPAFYTLLDELFGR